MLYFVGIGPGDPELVTVKAARLVREADAIAYADTGMGSSAVESILGDRLAGKPLCPVSIPMRGSRADWLEAHRRAAEKLLTLLKGKAYYGILCLGNCPGIYAYLIEAGRIRH